MKHLTPELAAKAVDALVAKDDEQVLAVLKEIIVHLVSNDSPAMPAEEMRSLRGRMMQLGLLPLEN